MLWQRNVVCKLFVFLCFVFHGAAPIPYVQTAILNLLHPYLSSIILYRTSSITLCNPNFFPLMRTMHTVYRIREKVL